MAAGSPTNSLGARAEDRVSCWSIASNGMPFGTRNPERYTTARSRFGTRSATAEIVIPPAECPTRMTLPSLSDAASFTNATTACVRSSCVTPAMGDRSAANAAGSNGLHLSDVGAIAFTPAPGRSIVKAAKPLALSIGVTLSHAEWLCQPPWIRTKAALVADIAEPSSSVFTIITTCISGRPPFRRHFASRPPRRTKGMGSNFPVVEKEHLNARVIRRKKSAIRPSRLSLRACKRLFDRRKVVEIQRSDPMNIGGSYRRCDVAVADLVLPETRNLLGERHVDFEVMSVKCLDVLRCPVNHYHPSHCGSPLLLVCSPSPGFAQHRRAYDR